MVTARPFNEKEVACDGNFDIREQIWKLRKEIAEGREIELNDHYIPHIRGLISEIRGNHIFWYSLNFFNDLYEDVKKSIGKYKHGKLSGNLYRNIRRRWKNIFGCIQRIGR